MSNLVKVDPETLCVECGSPPMSPTEELWVRTEEGDLCHECATLLGFAGRPPRQRGSAGAVAD